ncbi:MAG: hypothetical protein WC148_05725 [Bacilli bacterium]
MEYNKGDTMREALISAVKKAQQELPISLSEGVSIKTMQIEEEGDRLWFILETPDGLRHTTGPLSSFYGCKDAKEIVLRGLEYGTEAEDEA